jgi:hypothetical protein
MAMGLRSFSPSSLIVAFVIGSVNGYAQSPNVTPVDPARAVEQPMVKVVLANGSSQRGRLQSLSSGEAVIEAQQRVVSLSLAAVETIERVSRAPRRGLVTGTLGGFVIGHGVTESDFHGGEISGAAIGAAIGAGVGLAIGGLVAVLSKHSRMLYSASSRHTGAVDPRPPQGSTFGASQDTR